VDFFWSLGRSVVAKLRREGLRGGVDSPERGSTIDLMHCSHTPEAQSMALLQFLQMATVAFCADVAAGSKSSRGLGAGDAEGS
jgi:hypothetical protein